MKRGAVWALAAMAALCAVLAAFGASPAVAKGTTSIRPFSLVQVGKIHLGLAADGRSATVQVRTNPPTVCAIAYGKTPSLGSIATDPDMGATAISDHTVVLSGLSPGTTYYYKLTAIDAQGLVFQTHEPAIFTTPHERAPHQRDVAIGAKVIAVSSQYSYSYRAANAVDGNMSTQWSSDGNGNRAFITIELQHVYKITGVAFITREMPDGSAITKTFAVVVDGRKRYGPFPAGTPSNPRVARVSFMARTLRFDVVTSTGGNTGAVEVEAFTPEH